MSSSAHSRCSITACTDQGSKIRPDVLVRVAALGLEESRGWVEVREVGRSGGQSYRSQPFKPITQLSRCRSRIPSPPHQQVCDYCISSLTGTVGMCVARLGGGDSKLAARSPSQCPDSPPSLFRQRQLAGPCDKEPAEFI